MSLASEHFATFILDSLGKTPGTVCDRVVGNEEDAKQAARRFAHWYDSGMDSDIAAELLSKEFARSGLHESARTGTPRVSLEDELGL